MTYARYTRYWAVSLASALCGGFIVIVRFAFDRSATPWIVFGVAIAATVFLLLGTLDALGRQSRAFSGPNAVGVLIGAWTIIAMLTLRKDAAGWLAFADGLALVVVSVRALALHEASIERVVYELEREAPGDDLAETRVERSTATRRFTVSAPMGSWLAWLANTGIAIAGGFIVVMTFALTRPATDHVSPRWVAFGVAIAAATFAIALLIDRGLVRNAGKTADWTGEGQIGALALGVMDLAAAIALIVTMLIYAGDAARWLAFALGCAMVGVSLLALAQHEITTERVRHELEVAEPMFPPRPANGSREAPHTA